MTKRVYKRVLPPPLKAICDLIGHPIRSRVQGGSATASRVSPADEIVGTGS